MTFLYNRIFQLLIMIILIFMVGRWSVGAAEMIIIPEDDQSSEKQAYDKKECHDWAVRQSGIDPKRAWMEEADERHELYEEKNKLSRGIGESGGFIGFDPFWGSSVKTDTRTPEEIEQEREQKRMVRDEKSEKYYRLIKECLERREYAVEINH